MAIFEIMIVENQQRLMPLNIKSWQYLWSMAYCNTIHVFWTIWTAYCVCSKNHVFSDDEFIIRDHNSMHVWCLLIILTRDRSKYDPKLVAP